MVAKTFFLHKNTGRDKYGGKGGGGWMAIFATALKGLFITSITTILKLACNTEYYLLDKCHIYHN